MTISGQTTSITDHDQGQDLATKTAKYWELSSIRLGRIDSNLSTQAALLRCSDMLHHLGPHRKLLTRVSALHDDIIVNRRTKKPPEPPQNLLQLRTRR